MTTTAPGAPGSPGSHDGEVAEAVEAAGHRGSPDGRTPSDAELAAMSRDDLMRLGAARDGVEIVYLEEPVRPGSKEERRAERQVAMTFTGAGLAALAFVVIFIAWPFRQPQPGSGDTDYAALYTPLLGVMMGLALALIGIGVILWAKKLMPYEIAVQERHEGASPEIERQTTAATLMAGVQSTGIARRSVITRALVFGGGMLGLMAAAPLIGGLIKKPGRALFETPWADGVRLVRLNGTPIRPQDMEPGALETVFPAVEGGNRAADAATMLIRLRPEQTDRFQARSGQDGYRWNDYVAFSKICTHAGCPVSLYEQETGRILCPCHQSQFDVTQDATPIFGPATRPLPQLAITLDTDGYFVATQDYNEAVGPAFWERST